MGEDKFKGTLEMGRPGHDGGIKHLKVGEAFREVHWYEGNLKDHFKELLNTKNKDSEAPKNVILMLDNYLDYFAEAFTRQMQEFDAYFHHGLIDSDWLLVPCLLE